ncbi:MAG: HigA family addiction module antitoxin, partial [Bacteroidia bacterium]
EFIDENVITQAELAQRMGRPLKTINGIVKGKTAITPQTAFELEKVLGPSAEFWLQLERNYQLQKAELDDAEEMLKAKEWCQQFPLNEMKKLGWIEYEQNPVSKTENLLKYFSVANPNAYHKNYSNRYAMGTHYRLSQASRRNQHAITAWLRQGSHQARALSITAYNRAKLTNNLSAIKELMMQEKADFFNDLTDILHQTGVKLVHTPCLPKAPLSGSTRWINEQPVIQVSNRFKRDDIFWFTLFHEIGHVLKHERTSKKQVFIEGEAIEYNEEALKKEDEANAFAAKWLLPTKHDKAILNKLQDGEDFARIDELAKELNTTSSLLLGRRIRLEEDKNFVKRLSMLGWSQGVFEKVEMQ